MQETENKYDFILLLLEQGNIPELKIQLNSFDAMKLLYFLKKQKNH